jgi:hypothetical protein
MIQRFGANEHNAVSNIDSQLTVSSTSHAAQLSQDSANEPGPARHSQLLTSTSGDCQPHVVVNTEPDTQIVELGPDGLQTQKSEGYELVDNAAGLEGFGPTCLLDSQDSTISEMALETRFHAFQSILENAKGKAGRQIGLLSTTDNHSTLETELTGMRPIHWKLLRQGHTGRR